MSYDPMMILKRAGARVVLRYLVGLLLGYGLFQASDAAMILGDPELEMALALVLSAAIASAIEWAWVKAGRVIGRLDRDGWTK